MTHLHPKARATVWARRPLWAAAATAAALLLTACASPGPQHTPLARTTPQALGLPSEPTPALSARWWDDWGDAPLKHLIDQALQSHPSLSAAQARVRRAMALADLSHSASVPQASMGADVTRQRYSANGIFPPPLAGNTWDSANLQASAIWSPDFFGQHAAEWAAALSQSQAAQADAAAAATALTSQIGRAYVALARLLAQRELAQRTLAQRSAILELTRERTAAGLDTQLELTQAEGALPDARGQIETLDEQIALLRHQLAVLSGQAPDALNTLSPRLDAWALAPLSATLGADLLGRRPEVVAARWRVEAATQDVAVARTQFYPNVSLSAFVGLNALGLDRLLETGSRQIGVSPALRLPLFDGGRLRAQLGGRQAELDTSIAQYNAAVLDAVREASDALSSSQSLQRKQREQDAALASAQSELALAQRRYGAGLSNRLAVLRAESPWLAQSRQAIDLRARQLDNRVVLTKALGGGWSEDSTSAAGNHTASDQSTATVH